MALLLVLLALWLVGFAVNWCAFVWILLVAALVAPVANVLQVRAPVLELAVCWQIQIRAPICR